MASDGYYSRPYGWLDVKVGEGSYVKIVTPFVVGLNGSEMTLDVVLKDMDISTSVNYASFIQSNRIEVRTIAGKLYIIHTCLLDSNQNAFSITMEWL